MTDRSSAKGNIADRFGKDLSEAYKNEPDIKINIKTTMETGERKNEERFRRLISNGEEKWFMFDYVKPSENRVLVITKDITERKETERAIKESEEKYRSFFDNASDSIFITDPVTRRILDANNSACNLLGYSKEELLELTVEDINLPMTVALKSVVGKKLQETGSVVFERIQRHKDGTEIPVEVSARTIEKNSQEVFLAFVRDITERKRAEEAKNLNETRLKVLVELNCMKNASIVELTDYVLEEAVALTKSKIGFLGFLDEEEKVLHPTSWSKDVMKECEMEGRPFLFSVEDSGLWGEAVRERKPVIVNHYQSSPLKKGYPEGHVELSRLVAVPVFDGDQIVAIVAVANKQENYEDADINQLTLLIEGVWYLLQRRQVEEELQKQATELGEQVKDLNTRFYVAKLMEDSN